MPLSYDEVIAKRSRAMSGNQEAAESYYRVRQTLGYLGVVLPFILIIGGLLGQSRIEPSISDFFHTLMRDIFVGVMCAIGIFLISYQGYERKDGERYSDNVLATIAGIAAFGVAFFPNEQPEQTVATLTQYMMGVGLTPVVHYASALIFFISLAMFCFFRFGQTAQPARRWIYHMCGWIIIGATVVILLTSVAKIKKIAPFDGYVLDFNLVFWAEAVGVWAFALSWLVKGHAEQNLIAGAKRVLPSKKK